MKIVRKSCIAVTMGAEERFVKDYQPTMSFDETTAGMLAEEEEITFWEMIG